MVMFTRNKMPDVSQLANLAPSVAIAVIFAYVMLKINDSNKKTLEIMNDSHAKAHEQKTKAFLDETRNFTETMSSTNKVLISALEKNAIAFEKNAMAHENLAQAVKNNTETTREMAIVIKTVLKQ